MIIIKNILTSGFTFNEGEDLLRFRFRMINIMLLISIGAMLSFALLNDLGLNELGDIHARSNYLASLVCLVSFFWLRQSKRYYKRVAMVTICAVMISFTSALLFVPTDEFRLVWFLLAVIVAHLVVGRGFGLFIVALSILIVIGSNYLFNINFSGLTQTTFVISLFISSLLLTSYSEKISLYQMELLQQNEKLKKLANRDDLTGIMSRRYFLDAAHRYFNTSIRNHSSMSMLMLDIDHFKQINDRYGHPAGDRMLMLFTEKISKLLRKSDIFGRLGGEEFGIVLFETDTDGAQILAEKIRQAVEGLDYQVEGESIKMTTSIGVSEKIDADSHFEKLMIRSDKALYRSKNSGRNCISVAQVRVTGDVELQPSREETEVRL